MDCAKPIRLIETYTFSCLEQILRSYSTFNRGIQKILQPIRLIEPVLIIETQEYFSTHQFQLKNTDPLRNYSHTA